MPNNTYSLTNIAKQEALFTNRFIDALRADMFSSKHASETNYQALQAGIYLLKNRQLCPQLTVEQIVRGTMNMAIVIEGSKYSSYRANVGSEPLNQLLSQIDRWFDDYNQQLKNKGSHRWDIARPVIERASKGQLFIATDCCKATLELYFEYIKQFEPTIATPKLPLVRKGDHVVLDMFTPEIHKFKTEDQFLTGMLNDLNQNVALLKGQHKFQNSVKIAEKLSNDLDTIIALYRVGDKPTMPKKEFVEKCIAAINKAKPDLEKEIGWGDYLNNLLKTIANTFYVAINAITGSNLGFFTLATAPVVAEVEEIGKELNYYNL